MYAADQENIMSKIQFFFYGGYLLIFNGLISYSTTL